MFIPRILICYLVFFAPLKLMGQAYTPFIDLLAQQVSSHEMEKKIDSFFLVNESVLTKLQLAECYHDRGGRFHFANFLNSSDEEELDKATNFALKALEIKRQLDSVEMCSINRTLFNLGIFHYKKGLLDTALSYFNEVIKKGAGYCGDDRADYLIDLSVKESAKIYVETGEYHDAMNLLEGMVARFEKDSSINDERPFWAYYQMAEVYGAMDLLSNSDQIGYYLRRAQQYIDDKQFDCCFHQNRIDQLEGNRLSEIGNYKASIERHQRVVVHLPKNDSINLAHAHNSLGVAYFEDGNHDRAKYHLNRALAFYSDFDAPHNNFGDIYLAQKQHPKALQSYQRAVDKAIDKQLNLSYEQLPTLEQVRLAPIKASLLNHLIFKADGWIAYYEDDKNPEKLEMALATIDLADQLVDIIRQESHEFQSKLFWREQGSELYILATKLSYLLDNPERAYYFMERNKALLLLEDLTHEEAKDIAQLPKELAEQEFKLKRNIFLDENKLFQVDKKKTGVVDSLKSHISISKYRYEAFIDSLNEAYPDYAKFKKKAAILTFKELQSNYISEDQAVLHYILNEEDGYGLLTGTEGPILFQLKNTAHLNDDIDTLTSLLSSGISDVTTFNTISNTLFNNLIPVEVYEKIKGKQLIIVPDYTLQRVPFETLLVDKANTKYLIEDAEIAYVYSMSLLAHNQGSTRIHSQQLLGVAPIHFEQLNLVELRNSEHEISGIAPFFDGAILLEDQASKANFLKEVGTPKIIHLATHADMGDGENPWIAFSDEKMYLKEIYATKNQSEMVVLSACNTLSGNLKRGEGVMSLARGFFYSGAKSVVSSLWPLTDEAGSDIMISFYQNLDKGQSKSKALRQAKLDYMHSNIVEELKHPFYWAGFVVVGDNAPLADSWHPIWIYIGIVWVLAFFFLFRRKFLKRLQ